MLGRNVFIVCLLSRCLAPSAGRGCDGRTGAQRNPQLFSAETRVNEETCMCVF